jgi:hypothetical protein
MQGQERERKEPSEFNVIVKAKDLVKHTFTITNSTERYPKKYRFTLVNRIQEKAVDIYEMTLEANELDLRQPVFTNIRPSLSFFAGSHGKREVRHKILWPIHGRFLFDPRRQRIFALLLEGD